MFNCQLVDSFRLNFFSQFQPRKLQCDIRNLPKLIKLACAVISSTHDLCYHQQNEVLILYETFSSLIDDNFLLVDCNTFFWISCYAKFNLPLQYDFSVKMPKLVSRTLLKNENCDRSCKIQLKRVTRENNSTKSK